ADHQSSVLEAAFGVGDYEGVAGRAVEAVAAADIVEAQEVVAKLREFRTAEQPDRPLKWPLGCCGSVHHSVPCSYPPRYSSNRSGADIVQRNIKFNPDTVACDACLPCVRH